MALKQTNKTIDDHISDLENGLAAFGSKRGRADYVKMMSSEAAVALLTEIKTLRAEKDKASRVENDPVKLRAILARLVDLYVANRGRPAMEFIAHVAPSHAISMTPAQRTESSYWGAFDAARRALGEDVKIPRPKTTLTQGTSCRKNP